MFPSIVVVAETFARSKVLRCHSSAVRRSILPFSSCTMFMLWIVFGILIYGGYTVTCIQFTHTTGWMALSVGSVKVCRTITPSSCERMSMHNACLAMHDRHSTYENWRREDNEEHSITRIEGLNMRVNAIAIFFLSKPEVLSIILTTVVLDVEEANWC